MSLLPGPLASTRGPELLGWRPSSVPVSQPWGESLPCGFTFRKAKESTFSLRVWLGWFKGRCQNEPQDWPLQQRDSEWGKDSGANSPSMETYQFVCEGKEGRHGKKIRAECAEFLELSPEVGAASFCRRVRDGGGVGVAKKGCTSKKFSRQKHVAPYIIQSLLFRYRSNRCSY